MAARVSSIGRQRLIDRCSSSRFIAMTLSLAASASRERCAVNRCCTGRSCRPGSERVSKTSGFGQACRTISTPQPRAISWNARGWGFRAGEWRTRDWLAGSEITQEARCRVDGKILFLVYAHYPKLEIDAWTSLARTVQAQFDSAPILVVMDMSSGRVRVDSSFCSRDEQQRAGAVIAASVVQASWAWDESERMRIEDCDRYVEVEARFDGEQWCATVGAWRSAT
jgi:hypothetical protein